MNSSTNVIDVVTSSGNWFIRNQDLLIDYGLSVIYGLIILFIGFKVAKIVSNVFSKIMLSKNIDKTVADFLSMIVRYLLIIITLITFLGKIGIQTASIIAVLGTAALAVGLALQNSLSNFAAGVLLIIFRPIRVSETIVTGSAEGKVKQIQIFSTTLLTTDGRTITIPNSKLLSDSISNISREPERRTQIIVGVSYDSDIDVVKKILKDVIAKDERIIIEKGVTVRLHEMGASSLNYVVRVWTTNEDTWPVYWDLMENFKRTLDEHKVGIPFPQMDVHLFKEES